jgi:hypothetical protein
VHVIRESGDVFKSKSGRAVGDIQIKGRPEPFAFIQLNPKVPHDKLSVGAEQTIPSQGLESVRLGAEQETATLITL